MNPSKNELKALRFLAKNNNATLADLAEIMGKTKSYSQVLVRSLEEKGFIKRIPTTIVIKAKAKEFLS